MRYLILLTAFAIFASLLCSCGDGGEYEITDDGVYYTYWTFSFGTRHDPLPDADPSTFESVKDWLGKDARHVYFKENLIDGADPSTIKADKYPLSHDARDYYYEASALHVVDLASFKVLHRNRYDDDIWAIDSRCAYYDSIRIAGVDVATFEVVNFAWARDKARVYRFGKVLDGADPATYKEDTESGYGTDKSHVWYYGTLLPDVDRASFTIDNVHEDIAHDKYGTIINGRREGSDPDVTEPEPVPEDSVLPQP